MSAILIIDTDVVLLTNLTTLLEEAGFQVSKSSDLDQGEQLYIEQRPDLIILEVRSEHDRGWQLLERFAAATPVIVLSSASREEDVVRGFMAGAVDYIPKPYRSQELLARIRTRILLANLPASLEPELESPVVFEPIAAPQAQPAVQPQAAPPTRRAAPRRPDPNDETVFMSEAEEMALLRMAENEAPPATPQPTETSDDDSRFGQRLRNERMRRHVTLVQVENELKIRMSYLQALEDEKFTLIPRGPVALQMVRTYANFLGLDANATVEEFRNHYYIDQNDPLPALGGRRMPRSFPTWIIWLTAFVLALAVAIGGIFYFDPQFFQNVWVQILQLWPTS